MNLDHDAFGQEIWDYYFQKEAYEIIERDDGHIAVSDGPQVYFSEYSEWPEHQKRAINFAKGKILDIGCGAGRHSLYLQNQGFYVIGIDQSTLAIKVCNERGLRNTLNIPISEIRKLGSNFFNTILMLGSNFGLFGNFNRAQRLLRTMHKVTAPDALIIAESKDPHNVDDPIHLEYHKANIDRGRMPGQVRIRVRYKKYIGRWFDYLLVSKEEMVPILQNSGWRIKDFLDSDNSSLYIAVLEKSS